MTAVFIHAHPDDEAILTAGTMARAHERGMRVVLMICTDGGAGLTDPKTLDGGTLASVRRRELETSAAALSVDEVVWLGFDDSGGDGSASRNGFAALDIDQVTERMAEALRSHAPHLVTIYDHNGGYRHPDHLRLHAAGHRAVAMGAPDCELWEATVDRDFLRDSANLATQFGFSIPPGFADWVGSEDHFLSRDEIDIRVDVGPYLGQRRASLQAHQSQQASPDGSSRMLTIAASLPDDIFGMAFGTEWYRRARPAGPAEALLAP